MAIKNTSRHIVEVILAVIIIILVNAVSRQMNYFVDLTEEKRFTLASTTKSLLKDVDDIVFVDVLLEGDLDSGFKQLQDRTEEVLKQFRNVNSNIEFNFKNPSVGTPDEINTLRQNLSKDGIFPTNLLVNEGSSRVEKMIYPYAIVQYGNRKFPVNLLEGLTRGESKEQSFNKSEQLLEYKLANAIAKLFKKTESIVVFTTGNGELTDIQTAKLEDELSHTMTTGRIMLDSIFQLSQDADILIVAKPTKPMSTRNKFIIDQYIMNGGKVIWLIDQFHINLDSINRNGVYIPDPINHNLDDMFFKYGIRINQNLILDLENSKIPQVIGMQGGKAQTDLFSWVYHPLLQANPNNPVVKNIDRVSSSFPSSMDALETPLNLTQTPLLTSSKYSRYQFSPVRLSFDILRIEQKPDTYNKSYLPVAMLVEGEFESVYKNRVSDEMDQTLKLINAEYKETSQKTAQIFVADGDIIKNLYDAQNNRISPIGFNKWEGAAYEGNRDFIINSIDYLLDDYGLIESRTKSIRMRLLNQVKLQKEKLKWQLINILGPVLFVIFFGLGFTYWRRKKYAS